MSSRFRDYQTCLVEFEQDILVKCPQCDSCTKIASIDDGSTWRIACFHCSYTKTTSGAIKQYGAAIDPLFGLPLWLQVPYSIKLNGSLVRFLNRLLTFISHL